MTQLNFTRILQAKETWSMLMHLVIRITFGAIVRWPVGLLERLRWSGAETGQSSFYGANIDSDLLGRFWVDQKSKGCPKRHPGQESKVENQ